MGEKKNGESRWGPASRLLGLKKSAENGVAVSEEGRETSMCVCVWSTATREEIDSEGGSGQLCQMLPESLGGHKGGTWWLQDQEISSRAITRFRQSVNGYARLKGRTWGT